MNQDLANSFFTTIDTLIDKKLEQVRFDETLACIVVKQIENEDNLYEVKYNNSITYRAVAKTGDSYSEGDQVYINIPHGNYNSQEKIILGKYSANQEEALQYKDPFENFIPAKTWHLSFRDGERPDPTMPKPTFEFSESMTIAEIASIDLSTWQSFFVDTSLGGYDYLGLIAQISISDISPENQTGEWILAVELIGLDGKPLNHFEDTISPYVIASREIYGNPYTLIPALSQKKLFYFPGITQLSEIKAIAIKVYNNGIKTGKLELDYLGLSFGYDANKYLNAPVHLFAEGNYNNNFAYNADNYLLSNPDAGKPAIQALLIDQENKTVQQGLKENQTLRWYQHKIGEAGDSYGGGYWKHLEQYNDNLLLPANAYTLDVNRPTSSIKAVICEKMVEQSVNGEIIGVQIIAQLADAPSPEEYNYTDWVFIGVNGEYYFYQTIEDETAWYASEQYNLANENLFETEHLKSVEAMPNDIYQFIYLNIDRSVRKTVSYYYNSEEWQLITDIKTSTINKQGESAPFTFTNQQSQLLDSSENSEILILADKTYLPIYDHGSLKSEQVFKVKVVPSMGDNKGNWGALQPKSIVWNLQTLNGLISGLATKQDSKEWEEEALVYTDITADDIDQYSTLYFKPKTGENVYNPVAASSMNNIIECTINGLYKATIAISFGEITTQGVDYSFKIEPLERFLVNEIGATQEFKAVLTTPEGIELDPSDYSLTWDWDSKIPTQEVYPESEITIFYDVDNQIVFPEQAIVAEDMEYISFIETNANIQKIQLNCAFSSEQKDITMTSEVLTPYAWKCVCYEFNENTQQWQGSLTETVPDDANTSCRVGELGPNYSDDFANYSSVQNYWENHLHSGSGLDTSKLYYIGNLECRTITYLYPTKNDLKNYNSYILKATCKIPALYSINETDTTTKEVILVAKYPIIIVNSTSAGAPNAAIQGIFELAWNSAGELQTQIGDKQELPYYFNPIDVDSQTWTLLSQKTSLWSIKDNNLYYDKDSPVFEGMFGCTASCTNGDTLICQIPLMSYIEQYDVNATNKWVGSSIKLDEEDASIMATMVGAGSKNTQTNTFTGVMMGEFALISSGEIKNGLYGFNEGLTTFGIDAKTGNAFFKGHVEASSGTIGGWNISKKGLIYKNNSEDDKAQAFIMPLGEQDEQYTVGPLINQKDWFMYLSTSSAPDAIGQFGISKDGVLVAEQAYLNGNQGYRYKWHPEVVGDFSQIPIETLEYTVYDNQGNQIGTGFREPSRYLTGLYLNTKFNALISAKNSNDQILGLILSTSADSASHYRRYKGGSYLPVPYDEVNINLGQLVLGQIIPGKTKLSPPVPDSPIGINEIAGHPGMTLWAYSDQPLRIGKEDSTGRSTYIEIHSNSIDFYVNGDWVHSFKVNK